MHRLVHREGSFVITFPNAYHAGFNTGALPPHGTRHSYSSSVLVVSRSMLLVRRCQQLLLQVVLMQLAFAGFNCAEAVNFGPPDWLPWGTYVANKYRREGRSATLSHDALLIALVTAAPDVQKRLERDAKVNLTNMQPCTHIHDVSLAV